MGLFDPHPGSWSVLGFRLPDFGLTEALTSNRTAQGGSNLIGGSPIYDYSQARSTGPYQSVLGNTNYSNVSGNGGTYVPGQSTPPPQGEPTPTYDPYEAVRNDISSSWDNYLNSLNNQLNTLSSSKTAQEGVAQSQYNQVLGDLDLQKTQGLQSLGSQRNIVTQNQAKTLRDLTENIRNMFNTGNVYLGARGAGESSAANMYSYALTKLGSRQRSGVMESTANILNDISGRETNLNNIYNTEKNNTQQKLNEQLSGIAQWFASAQQTIQNQQAQGQLGKGQDLASLSKTILNQGLNALNSVYQQSATRQAMLDQWAVNNSTNLSQLRGNLTTLSNPAYPMPTARSVNGVPTLSSNQGILAPAGYGFGSDRPLTLAPIGLGAPTPSQNKDIYGNPIYG